MAEELTHSMVERWPANTECPFQTVPEEIEAPRWTGGTARETLAKGTCHLWYQTGRTDRYLWTTENGSRNVADSFAAIGDSILR